MIPMGIKVDHEYHIIEFNNFLPPEEMFDWLWDNFGDGSDGRWLFKFPNLYFANSKDHLLFTLKWS